jgi:hypothetical protein
VQPEQSDERVPPECCLPCLHVGRDSAGSPRASVIAFYLPQFHPNPINDRAWGPGFSEWTHVAAARPLFRGHEQPKIPGELGFYDLRLPETRAAQAGLAQRHGVAAFCYWHYWFGNGNTALERPFAEVLTSGEPDFPFCLGWANHSWTAKWRGAPNEVLVAQEYPGDDDYRKHFDALLPAFHDHRYFRVGGAPLFYIFRPWEVPDLARFADLWRSLAAENGLPGIFFAAQGMKSAPWHDQGADATVLVRNMSRRSLGRRVRQRIRGPRVATYEDAITRWAQVDANLEPGFIPSLTTNWDDTPRYGRRGHVMAGCTPERFGRQVRATLDALDERANPHRLVFLKSWNEWAEGNYIEPDQRYGRAFLETLAAELGVTP